MKLYEAKQGKLIFMEGSQATHFCILKSGALEVVVNGNVKCEIKEGQGFGETALLHKCERTASVIAKITS